MASWGTEPVIARASPQGKQGTLAPSLPFLRLSRNFRGPGAAAIAGQSYSGGYLSRALESLELAPQQPWQRPLRPALPIDAFSWAYSTKVSFLLAQPNLKPCRAGGVGSRADSFFLLITPILSSLADSPLRGGIYRLRH